MKKSKPSQSSSCEDAHKPTPNKSTFAELTTKGFQNLGNDYTDPSSEIKAKKSEESGVWAMGEGFRNQSNDPLYDIDSSGRAETPNTQTQRAQRHPDLYNMQRSFNR